MLKQLYSNAFILLIMVTLCGCVQVFPDPGPPPQIFSLNVDVPPNNSWMKRNWQISVAEPTTNLMLNSQRIAIHFQEGNEIPKRWDYVKSKKWIERLPSMLQASIVEQLTKTQKLKGVAPDSITLNSDYSLLTTIYEFHIEEAPTDTSYVTLRLFVQLQDNKSKKIVASKVFSQKQSVPQKTFPAFKQAFDTAYSLLLQDCLNWVLGVDVQKRSH